jgi:hypothetical protein
MDTDRQAAGNPLEDWVISDKESLVAWVSRFLWHYEGVCSGNGVEECPDKPEEIIVNSIFKALAVSAVVENPIHSIQLKDPSFHFQGGEGRQV